MLLPLLPCDALVSRLVFPPVDKNGDVCISILHEPGEDKYGYEKPEERWLPIHTVETIMISVISMLADPNSDSPANVDAAVSSLASSKLKTRQKGGFPLLVLSIETLTSSMLHEGISATLYNVNIGWMKPKVCLAMRLLVFLKVTQLDAGREDVSVK